MGDFFENLFSVDSKLIASLVPLLLRPGLLTRAFIDGKRIRFLPPVRMYLVFSVLFFLSLNIAKPDFEGTRVHIDKGNGELITLRNRLSDDEVLSDVTRREAALAQLDEIIEDREKPREEKDEKALEEMTFFERLVQQNIVSKAERLEEMEGTAFLERIYPLLMSYLSWSLFLLMPVFALIMKLLYIRRDPVYLDHLIFAFHYHSFVFLFLTLSILWQMAMPIDVGEPVLWITVLTIPIYLYRSMRRVYGQGRLQTLIKMTILCGTYFFALVIASTLAAMASFVMLDL